MAIYSVICKKLRKSYIIDILDLCKAPPSPDQLTSADSGLTSLDVAQATSPSVKPLSARVDLPWERAILHKSSIAIKMHKLMITWVNGFFMRLRAIIIIRHNRWWLVGFATLILIITTTIWVTRDKKLATVPSQNLNSSVDSSKSTEVVLTNNNPLANQKFYIDNSREITKLAEQYRLAGNAINAQIIDRIASQPGTTWLVGPSLSDPLADRDIATVTRTSMEAKSQGTIPIYQLYAIPGRDACASYSKGGFKTSQEYLIWLDKIIGALESKAVFSVEADAIAQTVRGSCVNQKFIDDRYQLLRTIMEKLNNAPNVLAAYLDAGHSEWFPDPGVLVEPLRKAGIDKSRGIAVNVSFFVPTLEITNWSKKLVSLIGGDIGVIIDTSRNGRGVPPANLTGESRWCNPSGRGIGPVPSTKVNDANIDAYYWGKIIGESDGACAGNPEAGVFVPSIALELAKNQSNQ